MEGRVMRIMRMVLAAIALIAVAAAAVVVIMMPVAAPPDARAAQSSTTVEFSNATSGQVTAYLKYASAAMGISKSSWWIPTPCDRCR